VTDPDKTPVEQAVEHAVDLFVYAPIGLLFEGATLLPQLVEKGKSQVTMARMIGKFAVTQGRTEATKAAGKLQDQAAGVFDFLGDSVTGPPATPSPRAERPAAARAHVSTATSGATKVARATPTSASPRGGAEAAALAIPDYDGLSASQVVNRLAGLSAAELASVQQYEAAHRGRKTILSKVAQLQGS
jgi:hypothetical protein